MIRARILGFCLILMLMPCLAMAEVLLIDLRFCGAQGTPEIEGPLEVAASWVGDGVDLSPLTWSVEGPGVDRSLSIELQGQPSIEEVSVAAPGVWARPTRLEGDGLNAEVELWPASVLMARLRVPRGDSVPDGMTAWISSLTSTRETSKIAALKPCTFHRQAVPCSIVEERLLCNLPAGRWNLRLKAPGWAARHLWDIELEAGAPQSLGTLELRHGATLTGQVTTIDGFADPRITRVWAVPAGRMPRQLRLKDLLEGRLGSKATIHSHGYFSFEDLAPGAYVLIAHQPGFALHDRLRVVLEENRETALREPIVLTYPTRLLTEVEPPTDLAGEPWEIRLYREEASGTAMDLVASGRTEDGYWQDASLLAGTYFVAVFDSTGARWASEGPLPVDTGAEIFLPVDLDLITVEGRVTLDEEPIPSARLWFGGQNGEISLSAETNEDGEYEIVLPRSGSWELDLLVNDPQVDHDTRVIVPEDGGRLDLRLPSTELSGRVTTLEGEVPQPLPSVTGHRIEGDGGMLTIEVGDDGRFEIRGMKPGSYVLQAESPQGSSDLVTVSVTPDVETPELTLVLRSLETVQGRVLAGSEGVGGARLLIVPFSAQGGLLATASSSLVTDSAGRFEVSVPSGAEQLQLIVLPPGFGLTLRRTGMDPGNVTVAPAEGSLQLHNLGASAGPASAVLLVDGMPVAPQILAQWAAMNGQSPSTPDELRVPAMPTGVYQFCRVDPSHLPSVYAGLALPTNCSDGVLTPGGQLTLSLP